MIGAIFGDIVGSRFEFSNTKTKSFRFLTEDCCFTDDTVMTCAVAKAILDCNGDYSTLSEKAVSAMQSVGRKYPNCGYGRKFVQWMFSNDPQPYNSCGNGSAMRISAVGFAAKSMEEVKAMSHAVTCVSHDHPEGLKGAEATAAAIFLARQGKTKEEIRDYIAENYGYDLSRTVEEYRREIIGHGKEICQVSVPQALVCFLEGKDYVDVIRNCISIGGDSDTIAAIAGGIAEAYFGVPIQLEWKLEKFLPAELYEIVCGFEKQFPGKRKDYDTFDESQTLEEYKQDVWTYISSLAYRGSWETAEEEMKRPNYSCWVEKGFQNKDDPAMTGEDILFCGGAGVFHG